MAILVTGGTGYIGSHTSVELLERGLDVVIADNLSNSSIDVLDRIKKITGRAPVFYKADVCDPDAVEDIFQSQPIEAVIHFAGLKAVGESVQQPLRYYKTNVMSTLVLLECMKKHNVNRIVFSSSATVYSPDNPVPYYETYKIGPVSPYGWTKAVNEQILRDAAASDSELSAVLLRYFNPIGAHKSGLIGENPKDIPNNLMPYIARVAAGKLDKLRVFGADYDTKDGTGVRDYIHVMDLAAGHVAALEYTRAHKGVEAFNLGTGKGSSVLEVLHEFEKACGFKLNYVITDRRPGDIGEYYANTDKAEKILGFKIKYGLEDMCRDMWNFQKNLEKE